mgnify:CR=1 FL=1
MGYAALPAALREFLHRMESRPGEALVAFSGGADSTALLLGLAELRGEYPPSALHACWVDHGIRPRSELDEEEAFVRGLAERLDVRLHIVRAEHGSLSSLAKAEGGLEAAARRMRYEALERVRSECSLRWLVTAHHADDQAETRLMRFFSGSGSSGLTGIPAVRGAVARPLLSVTRSEILAFLAEKGQSYREDSTNDTTEYLRNRVRHHLVPAIEAVFPSWKEALETAATKLREDDEALSFLGDGLVQNGRVSLESYLAAPRALRERSLYSLADGELARKRSTGAAGKKNPGEYCAGQVETDPAESRLPWRFLRDLDEKLGGIGRRAAAMPLGVWNGLSFQVDHGYIQIVAATSRGEFTSCPGFSVVATEVGVYCTSANGSCRLYWRDDGSGVRGDAFSWPLTLRTRKPGDAIQTRNGMKPVDKLLCEWGVAAPLRDDVVLLEDPEGVVAILGTHLGYGNRYRYNPALDATTCAFSLGIEMKGVARYHADRRR